MRDTETGTRLQAEADSTSVVRALYRRLDAWVPGSPERERRLSAALAAVLLALAAALSLQGCAVRPPPVPPPPAEVPELQRQLRVTATAYNSLVSQTDGKPELTAFGIRLRPGMRVIAVSRDLYRRGLREGARVRIEGLPGEWVVADRMNSRWGRRIDVYMGKDEAAAREYGKQKVTIYWTPGEVEVAR